MLRSAQVELHLNRFSQSYMAIGLHANMHEGSHGISDMPS